MLHTPFVARLKELCAIVQALVRANGAAGGDVAAVDDVDVELTV